MKPLPLLFKPIPAHPAAPEVGVHHKAWEHAALKVLSWGGLATAGLALAPVVFPWFSVNAKGSAASAIALCTTNAASGWAGSVSGLLSGIPVIGPSVAAGGFAAAAISGGIAIGGMLLANYVDKRTRQGEFRWGSVIRWASLATSILIALPAILPAISMGLMFFGTLWEAGFLQTAAQTIGSLGATGAVAQAAGGATAGAVNIAGLAAIHALTCALPLGITGFFLGQKEEKPMPKLQLPAFGDGRVTQPPPLARATA